MFDFLILKSKIFTRNEPQVKVTSQLKVPSKHPSHRYSDFILDFKSVITIELCYGSARQPSLPLFVATPRKNRLNIFNKLADSITICVYIVVQHSTVRITNRKLILSIRSDPSNFWTANYKRTKVRPRAVPTAGG